MSSQYMLACDNLTKDQLRKYNVSELQSVLTQMGLPSTGKKHELVDRVYQFWRSLETPETEKPVVPTSAISFRVQPQPNILEIKSRLEAIGPLQAMLYLPDSGKERCLTMYRTTENAQRFLDLCEKYGYEDSQFISEVEIERQAKDHELIDDSFQISNTTQKTFYKTTCEPRIYWCSASDYDSDEEDGE